MEEINLLKRYKYEIVANDFSLAGKCSSEIKKNLKKLGVEPKIIRKVSIVSYEAEINIVIHTFGGALTCDLYEDRIVVLSDDVGPGIEDIGLAMTEGYSTASNTVREYGFGAGMGLPNMKKWSDKFDIKTSKRGTHISMTIML